MKGKTGSKITNYLTKFYVKYTSMLLTRTLYHTRNKIFYHGNSYGLQKEFKVNGFVRTS